MSNIRGSSAGGSNVSSPLNSRRGSSVTNADDDSEEQRRMAAEVEAARKRVEDIRRKRASRPERKMVRKKSSNKDLGKKAELGHSRHKKSRRADSRRTKEATRRNPTEESRTKTALEAEKSSAWATQVADAPSDRSAEKGEKEKQKKTEKVNESRVGGNSEWATQAADPTATKRNEAEEDPWKTQAQTVSGAAAQKAKKEKKEKEAKAATKTNEWATQAPEQKEAVEGGDDSDAWKTQAATKKQGKPPGADDWVTQAQDGTANAPSKANRKSGAGEKWELDAATVARPSSLLDVEDPADPWDQLGTFTKPSSGATIVSSAATFSTSPTGVTSAGATGAASFQFDWNKDRAFKGNVRHTRYEELPPELKRHINAHEWASLRKSIPPRPWVTLVMILLLAPIPFVPLYCSRASKAGCKEANKLLMGRAHFSSINGSTVQITVRDTGGLSG